MTAFTPHLDILPAEQQELWPRLKETPDQFTLYGGTALALRLGHRVSVDFDVFGNKLFDPQALLGSISYLKGAEVRQMAPNTLVCEVNDVLVSFFGVPGLRLLAPTGVPEGHTVKVAGLLDIAATKVKVVQQRASWKDYVDLHTILKTDTVTLGEALTGAKELYGESFNPLPSLKALTYFDDPGMENVTPEQRSDLIVAVQAVHGESVDISDQGGDQSDE